MRTEWGNRGSRENIGALRVNSIESETREKKKCFVGKPKF